MASLKCPKSNQSVEIDCDEFLVGRNPNAHFVLMDPACSRAHFQITRHGEHFWLDVVSGKEVFLNGVSVLQRMPLADRDSIDAGETRLVFEDLQRRGQATRLLQNEDAGYSPLANLNTDALLIPVGMKVVLGRDPQLTSRQLDHIQVSRLHAEVFCSPTAATIRDLNSSNGTFVNGQRIHASRALQPTDRVDIGPFSFEFTGDRLEVTSTPDVELTCIDITRVAAKSQTPILRGIHLAIRPGEFVCILGPSGAGKSTLLRALSNRENRVGEVTGSGQVMLNGRDLYEEFGRLRHKVSVVPQHEVLFDQLPLHTSLYYTAKLRLPSDTIVSEIHSRINDVLRKVRLSDRREWPINKLSGGERKRAALATEILAEPNLLFLDEVTSGLDELTDSDMMKLFRRIADDGKSVICVTHTLACVSRDCDLVVALSKFGRLAFVGPPAEAKEYFGVSALTDVYEALDVKDETVAEELSQQFLASDYAETYLKQRLKPWCEINTKKSLRIANKDRPSLRRLCFQFSVLLQRYARLVATDRNANLMRVLQCLLVAILMSSVFGDVSANESRQVLCAFLVVLSCYWFGCNNAAKELVKERKVFAQERDVSVNVVSYLASKVVLLSVLGAFQAMLLVLIVRAGTSLPGSIPAWIGLATIVSIAGATAGLAISAWSSSEEVAIGFVPIWLIPQIILSGAIVPLVNANSTAAIWAISAYSGVESAKDILSLPGHSNAWLPITVLVAQSVVAVGMALARVMRRN